MTIPDDFSALDQPADPADPLAQAEARVTALLRITDLLGQSSLRRAIHLEHGDTSRRILGDLLAHGWTPPRKAAS